MNKEQNKTRAHKEAMKSSEEKFEFPLQKENYIMLAIGFAVIVIGFLLMVGGKVDDPNTFFPNHDPSQTPAIFSFRRITLAPIVVISGFLFEIYAIMKKPKNEKR